MKNIISCIYNAVFISFDALCLAFIAFCIFFSCKLITDLKFFATFKIRSNGEIVPEATFYEEGFRKDQQRRTQEAIFRSLESRKDDLERSHQAHCLKTLDEIEKIERVRRIRVRILSGQ